MSLTNQRVKSTRYEEVSETQNVELQAVAKTLFDRLKRHLSNPTLEVEVRLCRFIEKRNSNFNKDKTENDSDSIKLVEAKVESSVSAIDFLHIKEYCKSKFSSSSLSHSTTRDVVVGGRRYTYDMNTPNQCIACVQKKRLFVSNILLPNSTYNLRFSASTEVREALPVTGVSPKNGFTRIKDRESIIDGIFRYDLTKVKEMKGIEANEVEIEGVFSDSQTHLTEAWMLELLTRGITLATLPSKSKNSNENENDSDDDDDVSAKVNYKPHLEDQSNSKP